MTRVIWLLVTAAAFCLAMPPTRASDQVPGKPQDAPVLLFGGDVYTVSGDVIRGRQVLFDKGKIVAVGKDLDSKSSDAVVASSSPSSGLKRIDVTGKRVYPGLFAAGNDLGLAEVRSVRGTVDTGETGEVNPNARAEVAVNPDSELIPV